MSHAIDSLPSSAPHAGAERALGGLRHFFRVPPGTERVETWHVSPAIDIAAYHFSWLWVLIPLLFAGHEFPDDYIAAVVVVMTFGFVHRHYTLGYAYLDREIFQRYKRRFIAVPLVLGAALLATPYLVKATIPSGAVSLFDLSWPENRFRLKIGVTSIIFIAGVWNIWHTLAQKYGILRIYSAKARTQENPGVPGWVDRLFVMAWLPLILAWVAPRYREIVLDEFKAAREFVKPVMATLIAAEAILVPLSVAFALGGVAVFLHYEWRSSRLRNRARLSMASGLLALWLCMVWFDPIKVYLAFAFSHGLEYMVFVWAFQRRRYAERREPQPLMARIVAYPWLAYPLYTLALAGVYVLLNDFDEFRIWRFVNHKVGNLKVGEWVFYWGVYQSLLHFYFDGFLWKTRQASVRESL